MSQQIKKCPFCGTGKANVQCVPRGYIVTCDFCKCNTGLYNAPDKAIKAWKTRR